MKIATRQLGGTFTAALLLLSGCSGTVMISPMPPEKYEVLGKTSGSGCGLLLFGDYVGAFIPINMGDRVERAKQEAISKVPGATDLVNVTISETWFYGAIIHGRCTIVRGEAIKS